jgi:uncharacterized membrane protein YhaH (DUF805 family)
MGMGEAIGLYFKNYVNFQGRSRRAEYWWPVLMNLIIGWGLSGLAIAVGGGLDAYMAMDFNALGWVFYGAAALWSLATILPGLSVTIRRLHDREMSGWWLLGFIVGMLIPLVNLGVIIAYIVIMALPGTVGPNRFGPDPKGGHDVDVFS